MPEEYGLGDLKTDLLPIIKRMPSYAKLLKLLAKDPRLTKSDKATLAAGIGYIISPIDLVPGVIPVLGQIDDILAVLYALRRVVSHTPKEIIKPYFTKTNLTPELIDADIATAKRVAKRLSATVAKKTGRGLVRLGKFVGRQIRKRSRK